jgi:hypothetical protein
LLPPLLALTVVPPRPRGGVFIGLDIAVSNYACQLDGPIQNRTRVRKNLLKFK